MLTLISAFPTEEWATAFARRAAEEALAAALAAATYGNYKWRHVEGWSGLFFRRHEQPQVRVVASERFHLENGSGFDSLYVEYLVLHVQASEALGNELFAYLGAEYEVMRCLSEKGELRQATFAGSSTATDPPSAGENNSDA